VGVKRSVERHRHKPNVRSIPERRGVELLQGSEWEMFFPFSTRGLSRERLKLHGRVQEDRERERGGRRQAGVVALAWRLLGGCVGLLPVTADLY